MSSDIGAQIEEHRSTSTEAEMIVPDVQIRSRCEWIQASNAFNVLSLFSCDPTSACGEGFLRVGRRVLKQTTFSLSPGGFASRYIFAPIKCPNITMEVPFSSGDTKVAHGDIGSSATAWETHGADIAGQSRVAA